MSMTYQITVPKIHCSGCVGLIQDSLGEVFGEENVKVDLDYKVAEITSEKEIEEVKTDLDKVFIELKENGYEYTDLKKQD